MTHSGGKPHTNIGDKGQRFEIRATGYPRHGEKTVIGWAADLDGAERMEEAIRLAPGCSATEIFDRQDNCSIRSWRRRAKSFDPACLTLAEHFLADEPTLASRAAELAGELQQTAEDWIVAERPIE